MVSGWVTVLSKSPASSEEHNTYMSSEMGMLGFVWPRTVGLSREFTEILPSCWDVRSRRGRSSPESGDQGTSSSLTCVLLDRIDCPHLDFHLCRNDNTEPKQGHHVVFPSRVHQGQLKKPHLAHKHWSDKKGVTGTENVYLSWSFLSILMQMPESLKIIHFNN